MYLEFKTKDAEPFRSRRLDGHLLIIIICWFSESIQFTYRTEFTAYQCRPTQN